MSNLHIQYRVFYTQVKTNKNNKHTENILDNHVSTVLVVLLLWPGYIVTDSLVQRFSLVCSRYIYWCSGWENSERISRSLCHYIRNMSVKLRSVRHDDGRLSLFSWGLQEGSKQSQNAVFNSLLLQFLLFLSLFL